MTKLVMIFILVFSFDIYECQTTMNEYNISTKTTVSLNDSKDKDIEVPYQIDITYVVDIYITKDYAFVHSKLVTDNLPSAIKVKIDDEKWLIDYKNKTLFDLVRYKSFEIYYEELEKINNNNYISVYKEDTALVKTNIAYSKSVNPGIINSLNFGIESIYTKNSVTKLVKTVNTDIDFTPFIKQSKRCIKNNKKMSLIFKQYR